MKIPSGEGVGMVNSPLVTQVNYNSYHFANRGELKLPFVTHVKFIIPTPPPEGIVAMFSLFLPPPIQFLLFWK